MHKVNYTFPISMKLKGKAYLGRTLTFDVTFDGKEKRIQQYFPKDFRDPVIEDYNLGGVDFYRSNLGTRYFPKGGTLLPAVYREYSPIDMDVDDVTKIEICYKVWEKLVQMEEYFYCHGDLVNDNIMEIDGEISFINFKQTNSNIEKDIEFFIKNNNIPIDPEELTDA